MVDTSIDAPFDKNGVYFFTVPKFHRTGTFRVEFHVTSADPIPGIPGTVPEVEEGGDVAATAAGNSVAAGSPPSTKRTFNIKPLEFTVQVSPRFVHTGGIAALHKLRAVHYLKHRNREEADAMPADLDLPFDSAEVRWDVVGCCVMLC